jgi:hypothetical protein
LFLPAVRGLFSGVRNMADKILGINTRVEIATAFAVAVSITGITKANPGVVTANAHGYANGDVIVLSADSGMVELDGQAVRVANVTTNTFELEGLDTTDYSTHSGSTTTAKRVTTWQTLSQATQVSAPSSEANRIDVTTLLDTMRREQFGLPGAVQGSISAFFDPLSAATAEVREATQKNQARVMRVTFQTGLKWVQNAYWSGGEGFELQQGAAATQSISFTSIGKPVYYAS